MKTIFILLLLIYSGLSFSQPKNPIDHAAFANWPEIGEPMISNNGKYVAYTIRAGEKSTLLHIRAVDGDWKQEVVRATNAIITEDSKYVLFNISRDSIGIMETGGAITQIIPNVISYKTAQFKKIPWLAYILNTEDKVLVFRNLLTGSEKKFHNIQDYYFSPTGTVLLLNTVDKRLLWIRLTDMLSREIARGYSCTGSLAFDTKGEQLAVVLEEDSTKNVALWYYEKGMSTAVKRVDDATTGIGQEMTVGNGAIFFSDDGKRIFFPLKKRPEKIPKQVSGVDIWSYKDDYLLSQQKMNTKYEGYRSFTAVIERGAAKVICLEKEEDDWTTFEFADGRNSDYVLVVTKSDFSQENWRPSTRPSIYLVSTKDGSRKPVVKEKLIASGKHFSPGGKYVIWYDREEKHYFTYDVKTGIITNITQQLNVPVYNEEGDLPKQPFPYGIAAWTENDERVFLYDKYDIWSIDPNGIKAPVNVTNGYGRSNQLYLRCIENSQHFQQSFPRIRQHEKLTLTAFDLCTKDNGFFSKEPGTKGDPIRLTMGPYIYYYCFYPYPSFNLSQTLLLKAKLADKYLITRMNATSYPNIFITSDFQYFKQMSDLSPQKDYNWMTADLIHWENFDSVKSEGILYKPENFDPHKKYPVILYFYEKDANGVNNYHQPNWSEGQLNISYFVSNGYVVFDPNIYYKIGEPGESAYNAVVSIAQLLSKEVWVDADRIGIQGHSFGGYEVNYIIGKTGMFAAAASAAGPSNCISMYGSLREDYGVSSQHMTENDQLRLGTTLWQNPSLYIKNSPIFGASAVTTPLLIMHNKNDGAVPWGQGVEFFLALRRLGKKVWMLQYDGGSHQVEGRENLRDYTIRLTQFFDHYLKGTDTPDWMQDKVPVKSDR